jgi:hypothetical protein
MPTAVADLLLADRLWIAVALLHKQLSERQDFSKDEIRKKLDDLGLTIPAERKSVNPHLSQHMVANAHPSTTSKYRMLFRTDSGNLRLYRPGDSVDVGRQSHRSPKYCPNRNEIPEEYRSLLDWYEAWVTAPVPGKSSSSPPSLPNAAPNYDNDPLIRLIGSGKHIWADEHADEYVENLRREDR